jgi:hypothetical protein
MEVSEVGDGKSRCGITMSASGRGIGGRSMNGMRGTGDVGGEGIIAGTIMTTAALARVIVPGITGATVTEIWTVSGTRAGNETATMVERKTTRRGGESEGETVRALERRSGSGSHAGEAGAARREKERNGTCTKIGRPMSVLKR